MSGTQNSSQYSQKSRPDNHIFIFYLTKIPTNIQKRSAITAVIQFQVSVPR